MFGGASRIFMRFLWANILTSLIPIYFYRILSKFNIMMNYEEWIEKIEEKDDVKKCIDSILSF